MKFTCKTEDIKKILMVTDKCVNKAAQIESIKNIKIVVSVESVLITATDLSTGIEMKIKANNTEEGEILIDPKPLLQFIQYINTEDITLYTKDTLLLIENNNQSITLKTQNTEDFPNIPKKEGEKITISSEYILHGLESVQYALSLSDIKPELNSVYIAIKDSFVTFTATDTFRLAEKKIKVQNINNTNSLCLPEKSVSQLVYILQNFVGTLVVDISETQVNIIHPLFYFTSRIIQTQFPKYEQIIPKTETTTSVVLTSDLMKAIKAATVFSDTLNQVSFLIEKEKIIISSENVNIGSQKTNITAHTTGEDVLIKCNNKYLLDVLSKIKSDSVSFSCNGGNKPFIIKPIGDTSFLYLVMPMSK